MDVVTADGHSRRRFPHPTQAAALAAAAIVAVHAVTDAFIARESGVRPADHIVSGLAPLALIVAACGAFWLSRAGPRAVVSLVLGALALEGFALAVANARAVGAHGDDWTGFALAPAGFTLIVLGVVLLWRSRKRQGRWLLRRSLIGAAAVLAVYWLVIPVGIALLATHRPHEAVETVDVGRPSRSVTLQTADGLDLRGRYVTSRNGAAVIVFPGNASRAAQARALVRRGYGVLMLDMRGYANSDGDANMFGWNGRKDVDAGVAFLARRADVRDRRIGGLGFSVGGEVMLEAAAGNRALRAVVADGAGERSVARVATPRPGGLALDAVVPGADRGRGRSQRRPTSALARRPRSSHCTPFRVADRSRQRQRRRGSSAPLLRGGKGAESLLEDPGGRPHGRLRSAPA